MHRRNLIALSFLLAGSVLPVALSAQQPAAQPDVKPGENQVQTQTPVQPERTPQQADQARQQDNRQAEDTRVNPNWTTRQRNDERMDRDRQRRIDQDRDGRTVGRNWHRDDDDMDRGARYGSRDRDDDRFYDDHPRRRVKICVEYENGDEFCRYRD